MVLSDGTSKFISGEVRNMSIVDIYLIFGKS